MILFSLIFISLLWNLNYPQVCLWTVFSCSNPHKMKNNSKFCLRGREDQLEIRYDASESPAHITCPRWCSEYVTEDTCNTACHNITRLTQKWSIFLLLQHQFDYTLWLLKNILEKDLSTNGRTLKLLNIWKTYENCNIILCIAMHKKYLT